MDSKVIDEMVAGGAIDALDGVGLDDFLAGRGLRALLFCGAHTHSRETHDVAVALRELLKDYAGDLQACIVAGGDDPALHNRFRVLVTPSLVLVLGGEILEVLPGVRDWADYSAAFQRYLGAPRRYTGATRTEYTQ
jgi:hydrogenase-1 operon protein HyaE